MKLNYKLFIASVLLLFFTLMNCQNLKNGNYTEEINGLKINYTIKGKGPVMLVGHPNSGKTGYELTLKPLESYFTMVYYDSKGTGKSETPKNISDYSMNNSVLEIEGLRNILNIEKIWLFGHSDQSAIAMMYALQYKNHTDGIILTGTSFVGTKEESYNRKKKSEEKRVRESEWFAQVVKDWDYIYMHKTNIDANGKDLSDAPLKWWCYDEKSSQKVIPIIREISKAGRRRPVDGKVYDPTSGWENYLEIQQSFSKIKTRILIINGKYDTNNPPEYAEQLHKRLPYSKFVLIEKAGHFPWIEDCAQTFTEIINWLKEVK